MSRGRECDRDSHSFTIHAKLLLCLNPNTRTRAGDRVYGVYKRAFSSPKRPSRFRGTFLDGSTILESSEHSFGNVNLRLLSTESLPPRCFHSSLDHRCSIKLISNGSGDLNRGIRITSADARLVDTTSDLAVGSLLPTVYNHNRDGIGRERAR